MKNKRILVLGIALILLSLIVGVAFAESRWFKGVEYYQNDNATIFVNHNDYHVTVEIRKSSSSVNVRFGLSPNGGLGITYSPIQEITVVSVERRY